MRKRELDLDGPRTNAIGELLILTNANGRLSRCVTTMREGM